MLAFPIKYSPILLQHMKMVFNSFFFFLLKLSPIFTHTWTKQLLHKKKKKTWWLPRKCIFVQKDPPSNVATFLLVWQGLVIQISDKCYTHTRWLFKLHISEVDDSKDCSACMCEYCSTLISLPHHCHDSYL